MAETAIEWADHINLNATGRVLGAYKSASKKVGCTLEEWMSRCAAGNKWCYRCRAWKAADKFSLDGNRGGGRSSICKPCNSTASTASRYRVTRTALLARAVAQNHQCPICDRKVKLVVDHVHDVTQRIRGLLCNRCNVGLGQFKDDVTLLKAAITYLEGADHG